MVWYGILEFNVRLHSTHGHFGDGKSHVSWIVLLFVNNFLILMTEKSRQIRTLNVSARPPKDASNSAARPQILGLLYGRPMLIEDRGMWSKCTGKSCQCYAETIC